jgi:hypothetical protein
MDEAETRATMKAHGWTYQERKRRGRGTKYVYAKRWQGEGTIERYICPLSKLGNLTEQRLLAKLAPKSDSPV